MAWIELHQSLWTHKKTIILAALLDINETYAAAHLSRFWTWALDNAQDGNLTGLPDRVIAVGAGWQGDASIFAQALVRAGWLDREGDSLLIHDWHDYAGRLVEKRAANKERMRGARSKKVQERADNVQRTTEACSGATVPNRTVPITTAATTREDEPEIQVEEPETESFYTAHKRVFGFECNPHQAMKLSVYIDQDGMDEAVVVRAIERAAEKGTGYRFALITKILDDYFRSGAKTLAAAVALDEAYISTHAGGTSNAEAIGRKPMGFGRNSPKGRDPAFSDAELDQYLIG
ncbi:DnaD domain-containing protein [Paenibacillus silvisoli]|uniref:DnaD domain-containing protein n=1 Tax=Paenibacillus silvisoli TaxID=3110539 RepID=UPI0028047A9C|nr:DnaD domain protein [Paenibacillus silvisoli]